MTTESSTGNAHRSSRLGGVLLWLWRLANTALLAIAALALWRQTTELGAINAQLSSLLDYLSIIAEEIR